MAYHVSKLRWLKLWTLCPIYTSTIPREFCNSFNVRVREKWWSWEWISNCLLLKRQNQRCRPTCVPKLMDSVFVIIGTWDTSSSSRIPLWWMPCWTPCVDFTHFSPFFLHFDLFIRERPFLGYVPENKENYQHNSRNDNKRTINHVQSESNT